MKYGVGLWGLEMLDWSGDFRASVLLCCCVGMGPSSLFFLCSGSLWLSLVVVGATMVQMAPHINFSKGRACSGPLAVPVCVSSRYGCVIGRSSVVWWLVPGVSVCAFTLGWLWLRCLAAYCQLFFLFVASLLW
eukprot:g54779.t1